MFTESRETSHSTWLLWQEANLMEYTLYSRECLAPKHGMLSHCTIAHYCRETLLLFCLIDKETIQQKKLVDLIRVIKPVRDVWDLSHQGLEMPDLLRVGSKGELELPKSYKEQLVFQPKWPSACPVWSILTAQPALPWSFCCRKPQLRAKDAYAVHDARLGPHSGHHSVRLLS